MSNDKKIKLKKCEEKKRKSAKFLKKRLQTLNKK